MRNPFLKKLTWTLLFIVWWVLPLSIHSFVLMQAFHFPTKYIITDTIVSIFTLAIISLSIWHMVRYTFINSSSLKKNINTHLIAMSIIFILWTGFSFGILSLIDSSFFILIKQTLLWRILLFIPTYIIIIFSYYLFAFIEEQNNNDLQNAKMEATVRNAEYETLKSQINPHFLFNSLNSASSLTITNPEKAQEMIINISDFFRYTLVSSKSQFIELQSELEHALLYLEIEKSRFGDKIRIKQDLQEELKQIKVPALILQPLIENAVKHGLYESSKKIIISFKFSNIGEKLKIHIENGIDSDNGTARKGTGTGLRNVQQRLELIYGEKNLLSTTKSEDKFTVTIWIPTNNSTNNK